jgi:hypothetical protein
MLSFLTTIECLNGFLTAKQWAQSKNEAVSIFIPSAWLVLDAS